mgnify:CR=1 FL=1
MLVLDDLGISDPVLDTARELEQIALKDGIKWTQVPMKGSAETVPAVLGGHVNATADSTSWVRSAAASVPEPGSVRANVASFVPLAWGTRKRCF